LFLGCFDLNNYYIMYVILSGFFLSSSSWFFGNISRFWKGIYSKDPT
jgi:hypothetical protein